MAFGINLLFRVGRKLLAEPLEDSGLLPGKYYRSQALGALEENDFPECLRYLKMAEAHRKAQARMVGQLLILRCRMLREDHQHRVQSLEERLRLEPDPETVRRYEQILTEEHKALQLLGRYVREAQDLVKKPENPTFPAHREIRPA
jgi:DNA-binding SARP family transcriptional activator